MGWASPGAGSIKLTGSNSYTGGTTFSNGYLQLASTTGPAIPGNITIYNALSPRIYTTVNNQFATGTVMTFTNTSGNARFELLGTTQTLAGIDSNAAAANTAVIQNYEQALISNSGTSTLILNGSGNYLFNGYIRNSTGTISLAYSGTGTQTLVGGNITYTGGTTITSGTLQLWSTTGFNSPTTVNAGGTLGLMAGNSAFTNTTLTLNGGTVNDIAWGYQQALGALNVAANSTVNVTNTGASNQFILDAGLYGSGTLTFNNSGSTTTGEVFRNSTGTNFTGSVVVNGGQIAIGDNTGSGAFVLANANLTLNNNAVLALGTNATYVNTAVGATLSSLNGNGTVSGAGSVVTLTVGNNNGSGTFSGTLINGGGTLSLTKIGNGTQNLTGGSTYTGATAVNAGTLVLGPTGSLGATAITINANSGFGAHPGANSVSAAGSLLVNPAARFDMNDGAIGTFNLTGSGTALTIGGASSSAGWLGFDLSSTGADLLKVTNAASIGTSGGAISITGIGTSLTVGQTYNIITATAGLNGILNFTNGTTTEQLLLGSNLYTLNLLTSATADQIQVASSTPATPATYWRGGLSSNWNTGGGGSATNFTSDAAGTSTLTLVPNASSDVYLTANSAANLGGGLTLGQNFTINSLTFTGTGTTAAGTAITINAGNTLTINAGALAFTVQAPASWSPLVRPPITPLAPISNWVAIRPGPSPMQPPI